MHIDETIVYIQSIALFIGCIACYLCGYLHGLESGEAKAKNIDR